MRSVAVILLVTIACGYPAPRITHRDDALIEGIMIDGVVTCDTCFITAISPQVANPGDTVYLEGTFVEDLPLTFPSGTRQALEVLGPHRAKLTIPAAAGCGDVSLDNGSTAELCAVPYELGLGRPRTSESQAGTARAMYRIVPERDRYGGVKVGERFFHFGGNGASGAMLDGLSMVVDSAGVLTGPEGSSYLATARSATVAVHIRPFIYVIGGYDGADVAGIDGPAGGVPSATIEYALVKADGTLAAFQPNSSSLTVARHSHAVVVIGNYVYVIGGFGANYAPLDSVERAVINMDGTLGQFAFVPNVALNTARGSLAANVVGNNLYVTGGFLTPGYSPSDKVERAQISADGDLGSFVTDPMLPSSRGNHVGTLLGTVLYLHGGSTPTLERATVLADGTLAAFTNVGAGPVTAGVPSFIAGQTMYQMTSGATYRMSINASANIDAFAAVASALGQQRSNFATAVVKGYLYVLGGKVNNVTTKSIERARIYPDGTLGPFSSSTQTLPVDLSHAMAAVVAGQLCVFGGYTGAALSSSIYCSYAGGSDLQYFTQKSGSVPRRDAAVFADGNYVYLLGGSDASAPTTSILRVEFDYSTVVGVTTSATVLGAARVGATAVVAGSRVYVMGGTVAGAPVSSIEHSQIGSGTLSGFTAGGTLTTARAHAAAAVVGDDIYVIGGQSGAGDVSTIERAHINDDDTLSSFAAHAGGLVNARANHGAIVAGSYLTVFGGGIVAVEQAPLK